MDLASTLPSFTLFPAIDLRGGQVVRLAQGDPDRQTVYAADPRAVAERWRAEGAEWLHVVNLDGAFGADAAPNQQALTALAGGGFRVQFGGGLRDTAAIQRAMDLGVARVVLGTAAVENPALVAWALARFGAERVAIGLDARDGLVRVRGWAEATAVTAAALGGQLRALGAEWCIFTDVARDGLGTGVNVPATAALAAATGLRVIASGGVDGLEDVHTARAAGLPGLIIGRALYEGRVRLPEALRVAGAPWPVELAGHGVRLRPPRPEEMAYVRWLWGDPATMAAVGGVHPLTEAEAEAWYARRVAPGRPSDFYCLILDSDTGEPVGEVSCHQFEWTTRTAMFNLKVAADQRGRGYGRAAQRVFLDWYFNQLGAEVMVDDLAPDNVAGQQALVRFGFERVPAGAGDFRVRLTRARFNARYGA